MYDNYNYPAGADRPDAPWNESEEKPLDFNIYIEFALKKDKVDVKAADYFLEKEYDDMGGFTNIDTSETNWKEAYGDTHFTILDMLEELRLFIERELPNTHPSTSKHQYLKKMLADCQGWKEGIVDIGQN